MIETAGWFLLGVVLREVAIHIVEWSERRRITHNEGKSV